MQELPDNTNRNEKQQNVLPSHHARTQQNMHSQTVSAAVVAVDAACAFHRLRCLMSHSIRHHQSTQANALYRLFVMTIKAIKNYMYFG